MNAKDPNLTKEIAAKSAVNLQYAALCFRTLDHKTQILLITSRNTGRWVIPKGWPISGFDGAGAAQQEAWEEAGVTGEIWPTALGQFTYDKILDDGSACPCLVEVFPLRVKRLANSFPEHGQRQRAWFSPGKAACRVNEPGLAGLLEGFDIRQLS
ncbi:MAG: NUDIX hydrolase [Pseudomonadota bacterium]